MKVNKLDKKTLMQLLQFILINATQINKIWSKIGDVDKRVPGVSGLVTTTALNTKNSGLVKKKDHGAKLGETEKKIITIMIDILLLKNLIN